MGVHDEFKAKARGEVESWRERLMMYLQDEETVKVLVPPAQVSGRGWVRLSMEKRLMCVAFVEQHRRCV